MSAQSPLVSPAASLTGDELQRYARQLSLSQIGREGQLRLKNARVLVIGVGGLGSPALQYLAAAGVGTLGFVDDDEVSISNLHRQLVHGASAAGAPKVLSAAAALTALNPLVDLRPLQLRLDPQNAAEIIRDYDLVIDGSDNFATHYLVADTAWQLSIPVLWATVLGTDGQLALFRPTSTPEDGPGVSLRDLYPVQPLDDGADCATVGVLGPLCGTVGSVLATEAIKLIVGFGQALDGRMLSYDALDSTWREVAVHAGAAAHDAETDGSAATAVPEVESEGSTNAGDPQATESRPPVAESPARTGQPEQPRDLGLSIAPRQLEDLLRRRAAGEIQFGLIDIREDFEREIVSIDGSQHVPMAEMARAAGRGELPDDAPLIIFCHAGGRTSFLLRQLRMEGWDNVSHLAGGIEAWVDEVEPDKPRY